MSFSTELCFIWTLIQYCFVGQRPAHQLNSKYTEASLEFIYIHQQHDLSRFKRKTVYVCKLMIGP